MILKLNFEDLAAESMEFYQNVCPDKISEDSPPSALKSESAATF